MKITKEHIWIAMIILSLLQSLFVLGMMVWMNITINNVNTQLQNSVQEEQRQQERK